MPRPVVFVVFNDNDSAYYSGWKIAQIMNSLGREARVVNEEEDLDIHDSVVVLVKHLYLDLICSLKEKGNIVVWRAEDWHAVFPPPVFDLNVFDGVIFSTPKLVEYFGKEDFPHTVIAHQCDTEMHKPNEVGNREFRLGYIGCRASCLYLKKIPGLKAVLNRKKFWKSRLFNCHFSVKEDGGRLAQYKPCAKIATAAACNSNIVTTRDSSVVEFLSSEYPYFTDSDLDQVLSTVQKARESFGSKMWLDGLAMMKEVRRKLDPERLVREWLVFLDSLG